MTMKVVRRFPRPNDFKGLVGFERPRSSRIERRLARCASVDDVKQLAARRVPRPVFDYVDGAAMSEVTLRRARDSYDRIELEPRVLRDVSDIDARADLLGQSSALPVILAPTGFTRMMHHVGEPAVARVAGRAGIPYVLSTLGTTSLRNLALSAPDCRRWFQLYVSKDRAEAETLMSQAHEQGFDTLIVTVDTAVGGIRRREVRNGLSIPPRLNAGTLARMSMRPRWWLNLLTTEPLAFASLQSTSGTVGDLLTRILDPALSFEDLDWIRSRWSGPLIVKGIQSVVDAEEVAKRGVDGLVLSNHGGRQIDLGSVPLELLPGVRDRVGSATQVYVDGGIMSGAHIVGAIGLGADAVLLGRAYLYGLMAGGEAGVQRVLEILTKEIQVTMQLMGARNLAEVRRSRVTLRSR